jgi:hypothetical protein
MAVNYNTGPIVTNGLVLCLDAGNRKSYPGSGTTWTDLSGRGNNGTLLNGVGYNSGNGGSLVFDGVNDYVNLPLPSSINTSQNLSVEIWVYADSSTAFDNQYRSIISIYSSSITYFNIVKWRSGIGNGIFIDYSNGGNRYCITTVNTIPSPNIAATVSNPLYDIVNVWNNIVVIINSNIMTLYINGNNLASVTIGSGDRWSNSNSNVFIGSENNTLYHKGKIAFTKFYNRALTASEIQQNYNSLRGRFGI